VYHFENFMRKIISFLLCLSLSAAVFAQKSGLGVSQLDSLPELIQYYLQETTSKHFEDPKVPRFLLKDRTDNFVFGVGGSLDGRLFYDNKGSRGLNYAFGSEDGASQYDNNVVDFTPFATNLTFKVLGKTKHGVIDGLINIDFGNNGLGVRLMQAYIDIFGLRIGKTNTAFRDEVSIDLVDCFADLSATFNKLPQISYSYRFKNGFRIQGGLEFPQSTSVWVKNSGSATKIDQYSILSPDLTANMYYTGKKIHVYAGVNSRLLTFVDAKANGQKTPCYAVQAAICWPFVKTQNHTHNLYLSGVWTHGMADCMSSMRSQGLSAVYDSDCNGYVIPNAAGGSLGYQFIFGPNTIDLTGSVNSVFGHQNAGIGQMYHWAYSAAINYFRQILTYGTIGAEVIAGQRNNLDLTKQSNIRAYLYIRYNF